MLKKMFCGCTKSFHTSGDRSENNNVIGNFKEKALVKSHL